MNFIKSMINWGLYFPKDNTIEYHLVFGFNSKEYTHKFVFLFSSSIDKVRQVKPMKYDLKKIDDL